MKTSTEINSAAKRIGEEKTIELVANAGFDGWDFSMFAMARFDWEKRCVIPSDHPLRGGNYLAFARKLRHIGEECGIVCNQSHAPFPVSCPEIRSYLKRAIECTAEAGGDVCVVHPDNDKSAEENAEMFSELVAFAKGCGVRVATENMWDWKDGAPTASFSACATPKDFNAHLDAVPGLVACLDIGHAEMAGMGTNAPEMIRALAPRLAALHIHDNDCLHDSHQIPFSMQINFAEVVKALREVKYPGWFTMEADQYLGGFSDGEIGRELCTLAKAARRLADAYEGKITL